MSKGLEALARLTDSNIKMQEIVKHFILITYDLPTTREGNKARQEFLNEASAIGAICHTESVYLLPDSPEAQVLALNLAKIKGGEVICWGNATPLNHAETITAKYDAGLKSKLREVVVRLDKIDAYRFGRYRKTALRMIPKTERLISNLEPAIKRRGQSCYQYG